MGGERGEGRGERVMPSQTTSVPPQIGRRGGEERGERNAITNHIRSTTTGRGMIEDKREGSKRETSITLCGAVRWHAAALHPSILPARCLHTPPHLQSLAPLLHTCTLSPTQAHIGPSARQRLCQICVWASGEGNWSSYICMTTALLPELQGQAGRTCQQIVA